MTWRRRHRAIVALLLLASSGCYTYRAVEAPSPGDVARVHVPVRSAVEDPNEAPETAAVEGTVVAMGDSIVLATKIRREIGAYREVVRDDTLRIAVEGTTRIELREFSKAKSVLLGGVVLGGATLLALAALGIEGGDGGDRSGGDGDRSFRVSFAGVAAWLARLAGG